MKVRGQFEREGDRERKRARGRREWSGVTEGGRSRHKPKLWKLPGMPLNLW